MTGALGEFVRRLWWRVTSGLGTIHCCTRAAVYVTDIYGVDPILRAHGHLMVDRHRAATTDSAIWLHRPIRADQWNLLESQSPAAARGRGVMTAKLFDARASRSPRLCKREMAIHANDVVRQGFLVAVSVMVLAVRGFLTAHGF